MPYHIQSFRNVLHISSGFELVGEILLELIEVKEFQVMSELLLLHGYVDNDILNRFGDQSVRRFKVEILPLKEELLLNLGEDLLEVLRGHLLDHCHGLHDEDGHGVVEAFPLEVQAVVVERDFESKSRFFSHVFEFS